MNDQASLPVSMTPFVLATAAVTIVCGIAMAALVHWFDFELGGSSGNIVTMIGIIIGASIFALSANRPMSRKERLRFAMGAMLVNLILPIPVFLGMSVYFGIAPNMEGVNLLMSGGESTDILSPTILTALFAFVGLLTFAEAYLFGWIMTRRLPK